MAETIARPAVEVGGLIDAAPIRPLQISIIVLCGLVMMLDGYDIQVMALAVPSVAESWGVEARKFSVALTAALVGIGLGAGLIGPFGDRLGRRPVMIGSLALCGLATLATALSASLEHFIFWRLVTGLGIGGSVANATALTFEYMPARRRIWLSCLMYCNVSLGAFFAGLIAPKLLDLFADWRGLFLFGGAATLTVAALVWLGVPESLKFLVARRPGDRRIAPILHRLAPGVPVGDVHVREQTEPKRSVLDLLGPTYRFRTLLLWSLYALTSFVLYVLVSWLPTLLRDAGWPRDEALVGAVLFQLGSAPGTIVLSFFADGRKVRFCLLAAFLLCGAGLAGLLLTPSTFMTWLPMMLAVGAGIGGAQCLIVALAAGFYPMSIKATGLGWAVMMGRAGSITGPLVGGVLIQFLTPVQTLGVLLLPAAICAMASLLVRHQWLDN